MPSPGTVRGASCQTVDGPGRVAPARRLAPPPVSAPRLLFCSPVLPSLSGNGLAMRAGIVLRALATRYQVSLLVVPLYWSPARELPAEIAASCQEVVTSDTIIQAAEPGLMEQRPGSRLRMLTSALRGRAAPQPWRFAGE